MIRFVSLVLIPLILVSLRLLRNGKKNWKVTVGTLASWMYADMYWMFFSFFFLSYACFNGIDFWICVNIFVKLTLRSHFRCLLLRSSDQEASPSAVKNTEIVLVPCRTWKCVPIANSDGVDISKVPGFHLLRQVSSQWGLQKLLPGLVS